jgi:hypothetical protein
MRNRKAWINAWSLTPAVLSMACLLLACDRDPFGLSCRNIAGDYCLQQWEDGETYYIETNDGKDHGGGGVIDGTVQAIAWSDDFILVQRQPTVLSDGFGYMVINVRNGKLIGPQPSKSAFGIKGLEKLNPVSPQAAWEILD